MTWPNDITVTLKEYNCNEHCPGLHANIPEPPSFFPFLIGKGMPFSKVEHPYNFQYMNK